MNPKQNIFSKTTYVDTNSKRFIKINPIQFQPERERGRLPSHYFIQNDGLFLIKVVN